MIRVQIKTKIAMEYSHDFNCKWCGKHVQADDTYRFYEAGFCSSDCFYRSQEIDFTKLGLADKGFKLERIEHNELERAFAEQWQKECEAKTWINHGFGLIQDLFVESEQFGKTMHFQVNADHRFVAATVVQWLGTNCGMGFLHEVLGKCGYRIVQK